MRATRSERSGERVSATTVNPDVLARGGFQVLQIVLRVVASGSTCPLFLRKARGPFASGCGLQRPRYDCGLAARRVDRVLHANGHETSASMAVRRKSSPKYAGISGAASVAGRKRRRVHCDLRLLSLRPGRPQDSTAARVRGEVRGQSGCINRSSY